MTATKDRFSELASAAIEADSAAAEHDFWTSRESLAHIHAFARARYVGPWALLGAVLVRLIAAVPPHIVLPPIVGGNASLNLFIALVDRSGGGKGGAEAVAGDAIELPKIPTYGPGSGEGLGHLFMHRPRKDQEPEQHTTAVILSAAEVDTLGALDRRQASTLFPELRKAWMGEQLGFAYADPTKRLPVPPHAYRLCLLVGVQPANAGFLLDDHTAGTPQRFLWLPANDPDAPNTATPEPEWPWHDPLWTPSGELAGDHHRFDPFRIEVCQTARDAITTARLQRLRGEATDELDGHALLTQEKIAAALALLDGKHGQPRLTITEEDWRLASIVRTVSDRTRNQVVRELQQAEAQRNRARGQAEGERAVMVDNRRADEAHIRAGQAIMRKANREGDWTAGHILRKALAGDLRPYFEATIDALIDTGQLEQRAAGADHGGHQGTEYRRPR